MILNHVNIFINLYKACKKIVHLLFILFTHSDNIDPNQIFQAFFGGGNMGGFSFGGHPGAQHFHQGGQNGFPGFSFQFG